MTQPNNNCKTLIAMEASELREVEDLQFWGAHSPANRKANVHTISRGPFELFAVDDPTKAPGEEETTITAQVNEKKWTIEPDSLVLKMGNLTYVFSVPNSNHFYVVVFSNKTEPEALGILDALLEQVSLFQEVEEAMTTAGWQEAELLAATDLDHELAKQQQKPPTATATALPTPVYKSSSAQALERLATKTAGGITITSIWLQDQLRAASHKFSQGPPTSEPYKLSDGFKRRMQRTARVSKSISRSIHSLASPFVWAGTKVVNTALWLVGATPSGSSSSSNPDGGGPTATQEVTAAGATGINAVLEAMEQAGYAVLTTARDASGDVAQHRYGADIADVTREGMNSGVYLFDAATSISMRKVARETAKRTAKNVLKDMSTSRPGSGGATVGDGGGKAVATKGAAVLEQ